MSKTDAAAGTRLDDVPEALGDTVPVADVGDLVRSVMRSMVGDITATDLYVHQEIRALVEYIKRAKNELANIEPEKIRDEHIPGAADELDAVVTATEDATGKFLDAAEDLESIARQATGAISERLRGTATKIYEASNFQDITGQRITKVVTTLQHIETKIGELAVILGHVPAASDGAVTVTRVEADGTTLHGPEEVGAGNDQDDIDKILADLE